MPKESEIILKKFEIVKQNIFVIKQLIRRDKQSSVSSTFMGELWDIINPFIYMVVMVLVFGNMFANKTDTLFPLYVLTGTTLYELFTAGTTMCLSSLVNNKNFLLKTQIEKSIYVIQKVVFSFERFMYSLIFYFIVIAIYRIKPSITWLWIFPDIFLLLIMMIGIGKILAVINVLFADITYFYNIFTLMIMYGSAIFYHTEQTPMFIQKGMLLNPIYIVITIARNSVIYNRNSSINTWILLIIYTLICYVAGNLIYKKKIDDIVAYI